MKIKVFILIFLIFSVSSSMGEIPQEISELTTTIKNEELEIRKLREGKADALRRIALISSKTQGYRRLISAIDGEALSLSRRIEEIKRATLRSAAEIKAIKKDVVKSNIFVIDNIDYLYMKIISTSKTPENAIKTLEILGIAERGLEKKTELLKEKINDMNNLKAEEAEKLAGLKYLKEERKKALEDLKKENIRYQNALAVIKHDEAGRLEYIELLEFQRKELEDELKRSRKLVITSGGSSHGSSFLRSKGSLPWPVRGTVAEPYGERMIENAGLKFFHKGVKIRPEASSDIFNAASGTVVFADFMKGFENLVIISHGSSYYTVYGNMTSLNVSVGETVRAGGVLGRIDIDPEINTSYLYFEIRRNETALDPSLWLTGRN